jgi:hypothetical protein
LWRISGELSVSQCSFSKEYTKRVYKKSIAKAIFAAKSLQKWNEEILKKGENFEKCVPKKACFDYSVVVLFSGIVVLVFLLCGDVRLMC